MNSLAADLSATPATLTLQTNRRLPRGLALQAGGNAFALDPASEAPGNRYRWNLPEDYALHDGQRITLRLALAGSNALLAALALEDAADRRGGAALPGLQAGDHLLQGGGRKARDRRHPHGRDRQQPRRDGGARLRPQRSSRTPTG